MVQIGLYYETLCPDCKDFMRDQLYPAYKAIPEIFTVDFVPYGNAMVSVMNLFLQNLCMIFTYFKIILFIGISRW